MFKHLSPNGIIIFVANTADISHIFRQTFRKFIFNEEEILKFSPRIIDDYKNELSSIFENGKIHTKEIFLPTLLSFPQDNVEDIWLLIRFIIGKPKEEIQTLIQEQMLDFIKDNQYNFSGGIGVLVTKKLRL